MPPTPGGEWAVARFNLDGMHSNDTHQRVLDPQQQYVRYYFSLNGNLKPESFIELAWVLVWRGEDRQAPTPPADFRIQTRDKQRLAVWAPSSDNLMVRCYELLRREKDKWERVTYCTRNHLEVPEAQLPPAEYAVRAEDVAGNLSALSQSVTLARGTPAIVPSPLAAGSSTRADEHLEQAGEHAAAVRAVFQGSANAKTSEAR